VLTRWVWSARAEVVAAVDINPGTLAIVSTRPIFLSLAEVQPKRSVERSECHGGARRDCHRNACTIPEARWRHFPAGSRHRLSRSPATNALVDIVSAQDTVDIGIVLCFSWYGNPTHMRFNSEQQVFERRPEWNKGRPVLRTNAGPAGIRSRCGGAR